MDGLDAQRITPEQSAGQRVMDMCLHGAGAVEGFAKAYQPTVGMDADPDDIGELIGPECLDHGDFHQRFP